MGFFKSKPFWESGNVKKIIKKLEQTDDQQTLGMVIQHAPNTEIALLALAKLTDTKLILQCLRNLSHNTEFALAVLDKFTEQNQIVDFIVACENNRPAALTAFNKLTDQTSIARCVSLCAATHPDIALAAFNKLTEPNLIAAKFSTCLALDKNLACAALPKIKDQSMLADCLDGVVNVAADFAPKVLEYINDQQLLCKIAITSRRYHSINIEEAVIKRIADQALLEQIVEEAYDRNVKKVALSQMSDPKRLKALAKKMLLAEDGNKELCYWVGNKLGTTENPYHSDWRVRLEAVKTMDDIKVLEALAMYDDSEKVCLTAVAKITDQNVLYNIAVACIHRFEGTVAAAAIKKINDDELLVKIVAKIQGDNEFKDTYAFLRSTALQQINNPKLLLKLMQHKDDDVKRQAFSFITDQACLAETIQLLYKSSWHVDKELTGTAAAKLNDTKIIDQLVNKMDSLDGLYAFLGFNQKAVAAFAINAEDYYTSWGSDGSRPSIGGTAIKDLNDKELLQKVSREAKLEAVREAAKEKLIKLK